MLRKATQAEREGKIAPDCCEIVARLGDGWTLRRMTTAGDFRREGYLMHNCSGMYVPPFVPDHASFTVADRIDLTSDQRTLELVSLRDADNLPHATAWLMPGHHLMACLGRGDKPLTGAKEKLLTAWCEREDVQWRGQSCGKGLSCFVTMRGVYSMPVDPQAPAAPWHAGPGCVIEQTIKRLRELTELIDNYEILGDIALMRLGDKVAAMRRVVERIDLTTHQLDVIEMFERDALQLIEGAVTGQLSSEDRRDLEMVRRMNTPRWIIWQENEKDLASVTKLPVSEPVPAQPEAIAA
jgi:hypothetical protein